MIKKVLQRFVDIWKLDFLAKFFAGKKNDNKTTVLFWIISNALLAIILAVLAYLFLVGFYDTLIDSINKNVPDNARITVVDGQLTTQNLDDPFFREISANNVQYEYDESFVIIIDSVSSAYDITSLDEYVGGIIVVGDRAYLKDESELTQIIFAEYPDFSISKEDIIVFIDKYFFFPFAAVLTIAIGVFMFIWFAVARLIFALWWAFMLFILMRIFDVKDTYMTTYKAVLNLYFIPTLVVFVVGLIVIDIPLLTTIIFIAIFIANLMWLKNSMKNNIAGEQLENLTQSTKTNVEQSEKK